MIGSSLRGRSEHAAEVGFWLGLATLVVGAGAARGVGLAPHTLWHDDLWVAATTRFSFVDALAAPLPVPQGFLALLWASGRLFSGSELAMQLVPFAAALAGIALVGVAVRRITGSPALGLLGAALVVWNAPHTHYSVFVKQYTLEFAVVALLIAVVAAEPRREDRAFPLGTLCCALVACVAGIGTIVVGTITANVVLARHAWRTRNNPHTALRSVAAVAAFNVLLWLYYGFVLKSRSGAAVENYWARYFVPTDSLAAAAQHLQDTSVAAVTGAFVPQLEALGWLVPLGLGALLWHSSQRVLGVIVLLTVSAMVSVSALRLYPLGGGRPDLFLYPLVITSAAAGLHALLARVPGRQVLTGVAAAAATVITLLGAPGERYFDLDQADLVRTLDRRRRPTHGLVIYPAASALTGFYSNIPIRGIIPDSSQLILEFDRPRTLSLTSMRSTGQHALHDFLITESYPRIWLIVARANDGYPVDMLVRQMESAGYEVRRRWPGRIRSQLILLERPPIR